MNEPIGAYLIFGKVSRVTWGMTAPLRENDILDMMGSR